MEIDPVKIELRYIAPEDDPALWSTGTSGVSETTPAMWAAGFAPEEAAAWYDAAKYVIATYADPAPAPDRIVRVAQPGSTVVIPDRLSR